MAGLKDLNYPNFLSVINFVVGAKFRWQLYVEAVIICAPQQQSAGKC